MNRKALNVDIGFAMGRKSFQKVLKTNVFSRRESGLTAGVVNHLNVKKQYLDAQRVWRKVCAHLSRQQRG